MDKTIFYVILSFCNYLFVKHSYQARDFRIMVHTVYIYY